MSDLTLPGDPKVEVRHAEYRLLRFLLCHPGQVFSRSQLLEQLWEVFPMSRR